MGRSYRPRPSKLAEKLLEIRLSLGLTQEQLIERLGYEDSPIYPANISEYESNRREPPLGALLGYAHLANVFVDVLINDELELPGKLPASPKQKEGLRRSSHRKSP